jgi:sulfur-oxidizing protein SoxY
MVRTDLAGSTRRRLLGAAGGLLVLPAVARAQAGQPWDRLEAARALLDGRLPGTDGLALDLPFVAEDGSSIPLAVTVDRPLPPGERIVAVHLFATHNPSPEIAVFRLSPQLGRVEIGTRIRLEGTQSVIAIAETSAGAVLAAAREVRITTSGCLVRSDGQTASDELQTRVRAPTRLARGEPGEVLALVNHPMETGLRRAMDGAIVPQRIIAEFRAEFEGVAVLDARLFRSVAANPFLRFYVAPERSGELRLVWTEDTGRVAEAAARIDVG